MNTKSRFSGLVWAAFGLAAMIACAACGSSDEGGGSGGSGGASGVGGAGGAGGAGTACVGDAAAWAEASKGPFACAKNSDCCVVINTCVNEGQVVGADKKDAVKALWPYCTDACTKCIPPAIHVECLSGECVGYSDMDINAPPELRADHCGVDAPPLMMLSPASHFTCGG